MYAPQIYLFIVNKMPQPEKNVGVKSLSIKQQKIIEPENSEE